MNGDTPTKEAATRAQAAPRNVTRKKFDWAMLIFTVAVIGCLAYAFPARARGILHMIETTVAPCARPITYSVGTVDSRFGISKEKFVADLQEAETIWEKGLVADVGTDASATATKSGANKNLFQYQESGGLVTVNLMYDDRQASTDKLKKVGIQVGSSRASYDLLKTSYDSMKARVKSEQAAYNAGASAYKTHGDAYTAEVDMWNSKGGAPKSEYDHLQSEKTALDQELANVRSLEASLNADVDTLNALATRINQLIVQLNINVDQYNNVGASSGEFEEGLYQLAGGIQTINIYEYSNHTQLVRVLAHELGHALGLEHVSDPEAIMYEVNRGDGLYATKADMSELNSVCRF